MLITLLIDLSLFFEEWHQAGFKSATGKSLSLRRKAIPVERDLASLLPVKDNPGADGVNLVKIGADADEGQQHDYLLGSRRLKKIRNTAIGYSSFAMISGSRVIGDIWYITGSGEKTSALHKDLKMLNIEIGSGEVYLFDMYVEPSKRGKALATWFMGTVLHRLHDEGFSTAYGFFDEDNIPALWIHRVLGYRELTPVLVNHYFFLRTAKSIEKGTATA